ncbi:MAG: hypothetical protein M0019_05845 [Actinomycetota bacterium]|nr:hypothetical protein [Actinomycetota bacterium]
MRVSAIQIEQRSSDPDANMATAMAYLSRAVEEGSSLIVLPELFKTGYLHQDRRDALSYAEFVTGETTSEIISHLRGSKAKVVFGMIESDTSTGLLYNSAVVVDEDGIVGCYRKSHLYVADSLWASSGGMAPLDFDVEGLRVRVVICADIEFPEVAYSRLTTPIDIICLPTAWVDEKAPSMNWWARAIESGASLICADLSGVEEGVQFSGGSSIIAPDGSILAAIDTGSGLVSADLQAGRRPFRRIEQRLFLGTETFSRGELKLRALRPTPISSDVEIELFIFDGHDELASANWPKLLQEGQALTLSKGDVTFDNPTIGVISVIGGDGKTSIESAFDALEASMVDGSSMQVDSLRPDNEQRSIGDGLGGRAIFIGATQVDLDGDRGIGIFYGGKWDLLRCGEVREVHLAQVGEEAVASDSALTLSVGVVDTRSFSEFIETRVVALEGADLIFLVGDESEISPLTPRPSSKIDLPPYEKWGPQTYNFSIVRQRAGENSTPIIALLRDDLVDEGEGSKILRQSGVFGSDYWTFPYNEAIFGRDSRSIDVGVDFLGHKFRLQVEKGYMRRRHPDLYGLL